MFRFFRDIRRRLIVPDNVRKYILYAIGEILLVMIGILIALQVNNWNEERKNQALMSYGLAEIHNDLKIDLDIIYRGIEPRLQLMERSMDSLISYLEHDEIPNPEQFVKHYREIDNGFAVTPTYGTYNTLKEKGLNNLTNEDLRRELIHFYESRLPRAVRFIHEDDEFIREQTAIFEQDYIELKRVFDGSNVQLIPSPSIDNYFNHPSFYKVLQLRYDDISGKRYRVNTLKESYFNIMKAIELELDARSVAYAKLDSTQIIPNF